MGITCPDCGFVNKDGSQHCLRCGGELAAGGADPAGESRPAEPRNLTPWPVRGQTPAPIPPSTPAQSEQTQRGEPAGPGQPKLVRKVRKVVRMKPKEVRPDDPPSTQGGPVPPADTPARQAADPPSASGPRWLRRNTPPPEEEPEEDDSPVVPRILHEEVIPPPPPPSAVDLPQPVSFSGETRILSESSFHPLADWWKRGLGFAIDAGVCILIGFLFCCCSALMAPGDAGDITNADGTLNMQKYVQLQEKAQWQMRVSYLMWATACCAYFGIMTMRTGQTIGKRVMRLRVVNADDTESEGPSGLFHGLLVALSFSVPCFWPLLPTAAIMAAVMPTRQTLHDMATKTKVIDESREALV